jgi:hypothetical protein
MSKYCCTNCDLDCNLEIIKSPEGINAIWNRDDNTVYCNEKCLLKLDKKLNNKESTLKDVKDTDDEYIKNKRKCLLPSEVTDEQKDLYRAVRQSRIENPSNTPKIVKI